MLTSMQAATTRREIARPFWLEWSFIDRFLVGYYVALLAAAVCGSGETRARCVFFCVLLLWLHTAAVFLVRSRRIRPWRLAGWIYRVVVYGCVQASYFLLRELLPLARHVSFDHALVAMDVQVFGVEPTLWADRFITDARTEWFAFFYFSYFVVLAVHVLPFLFVVRRQRLFTEFATGILFVFCIAHLLYILVPGDGPYVFLASQYRHALARGRFYDLVSRTVAAGGAGRDIFPSLHTAAPTFIALFSFRHRDDKVFGRSWPIVIFFALNIIAATIYLRWHYAIDVVAGVLLAAIASFVGRFIAEREPALRAELGRTPSWPHFRVEVDEPPMATASSCPECNAPGARVLYRGAPMWMCTCEACPRVWGLMSFLPLLSASRRFVQYRGSYVEGVWFWLTVEPPPDDREETLP